MRARRLLAGAVATVALGAVAALPASGAGGHRAAPARAAASDLSATIRRTEHGVPHIEASSFRGAGYGYGYAFAQDNLCVMADDYVTVDGQRSRFFGPDESYSQRGNGTTPNNLNSDFFWQQIIDSHIVDELLAEPPPNGPEQQIKDGLAGFVAGYNRYLADVGGTDGVPDKTCRGKPWVQPITTETAYRRLYQLILIASSGVAVDGIGEAQPPTPALSGGGGATIDPQAIAQGLSKKLPLKASGSNGVAVGRAGTRDHKHGLLLGNPHFPWMGTERFYQAQITIPGQVDAEGGSLFGVPLVLIGHTAGLAWTHTVSTAYRFTPFQLTLVPGSPTTYLYDGKPTQMTSRTVTVQSLQPDGSLKPMTRTLWSTRFGPILDSLVGIPLPWTPATAFTMGDANARNFRAFNHFIDTDRAQSAPELLSILKKYEGIPWVNTIAADKQGNALYADIGTVPNVSNDKAAKCNTAVGKATFQLVGLPVLDGSRADCNWDTDPDSVVPGIFGSSHMPALMRDDYVTNSNDSYWLSNPHQPLTGFARIIGDENTPRSLRTRIGLIMTQARVDGSDHLGPPGFTRQDMQNMVFSDRQYGGELVRDDLVSMCRGFSGGVAPSSSGPVQLDNACDILAHWDLHENLGSKGAILFRRFWERALGAQGGPWKDSFDPNDAVHTPHTLDTGNPQVQSALGDAVNDLKGAHYALDAAPGDVQYTQRGDRRIPIHGGPGDPDGDFNAINLSWTPQGYGAIPHGSSYVQAVTWNDSPCPDAATILTYSLATSPASPWYADQTDLFSRKQWLTERFCRSDVLAHTLLTTTLGPTGGSHACVRTRHHHRRHRHRARASARAGCTR
ncbi:MAG: penicillin acylase family protein [Gaiellaceae bacterium]